jgi:hypothetical protein
MTVRLGGGGAMPGQWCSVVEDVCGDRRRLRGGSCGGVGESRGWGTNQFEQKDTLSRGRQSSPTRVEAAVVRSISTSNSARSGWLQCPKLVKRSQGLKWSSVRCP